MKNSHFNENGAERKDTSEEHDDGRFHEPLLLWDGPGDSVHSAWAVILAS